MLRILPCGRCYLRTKDKIRLVRESVSVSVNVSVCMHVCFSVCVCLRRGKGRRLAVNSFNVLGSLLTAGAAIVDKASMFLPQEVPVLVREDRY